MQILAISVSKISLNYYQSKSFQSFFKKKNLNQLKSISFSQFEFSMFYKQSCPSPIFIPQKYSLLKFKIFQYHFIFAPKLYSCAFYFAKLKRNQIKSSGVVLSDPPALIFPYLKNSLSERSCRILIKP
jgi:hypothetical protein